MSGSKSVAPPPSRTCTVETARLPAPYIGTMAPRRRAVTATWAANQLAGPSKLATLTAGDRGIR